MIRKFISYLFPPRRLHDKLPARSLSWSSDKGRHGKPDEATKQAIARLKLHNIVRTDADGQRMLAKYKDLSIDQIIKAEKRKRRHEPRLSRAWRRLKRLWNGY